MEEGDDKDECAFRTVMTVLAEEGIKSSVSSSCLPSSTNFIPDERFAAAAIGGRVDVIGGDSAMTLSAPMKRKIAHLVCQCCFIEYEFNSMVSCRYGGHLFCMDCLRKHTEQRVFGNGNFGKVCAIAAGQKRREQGPDDQHSDESKREPASANLYPGAHELTLNSSFELTSRTTEVTPSVGLSQK
ncbi:hypothetical protein ACHAXH_005925 [Discostella pseudostelligera]